MSARGNRQRFRLRPVKSYKHIIETNGLVTLALPSVTDVINTVDNPVLTTTNGCQTGSTVYAIYLRVEVKGGAVEASGVTNIYMAVFHNVAGSLAAPALDTLGSSDRKNQVIHQEMLMLTPATAEGGFPRTLFNGVISIPRGMRRNAVQDKLQVILQQRSGETNQTTAFCIECIYKEFR